MNQIVKTNKRQFWQNEWYFGLLGSLMSAWQISNAIINIFNFQHENQGS